MADWKLALFIFALFILIAALKWWDIKHPLPKDEHNYADDDKNI